MSYKLVIDNTKLVGLIKSIQLSYKRKGFTSVKELSPRDLIEKSGIPPTGIIASNLFDWLVKKDYLQKMGGRGRAVLSYKWVDTLYDPETIAARYLQFINTLTDKQPSQVRFNPGVKPAQFNLNDEVYFLESNRITRGIIKGIYLVSSEGSSLESTRYKIARPNHASTDISHEDVFPSIDLLLMHLKSNYEKSH